MTPRFHLVLRLTSTLPRHLPLPSCLFSFFSFFFFFFFFFFFPFLLPLLLFRGADPLPPWLVKLYGPTTGKMNTRRGGDEDSPRVSGARRDRGIRPS